MRKYLDNKLLCNISFYWLRALIEISPIESRHITHSKPTLSHTFNKTLSSIQTQDYRLQGISSISFCQSLFLKYGIFDFASKKLSVDLIWISTKHFFLVMYLTAFSTFVIITVQVMLYLAIQCFIFIPRLGPVDA